MHRALAILKEKSATPQARLDALWHLLETAGPPADRAAMTAMAAILQDTDDHVDVRSAVALSLGKLGHQPQQAAACLAGLVQALSDAHPTVRHYAARALGMLGRAEAVSALIAALGDADHLVFHTAAESLGRLGEAAHRALLALLQSEAADDARCVAAWKLGEGRCVQAIPVLAQAVRQEPNPELVALCAWALGEIGLDDEAALSALRWAQQCPEPAVCERARRALRKIARHYN